MTIGSETCVSHHSVAFWKKLSQQRVVYPVTSPDISSRPFQTGLGEKKKTPMNISVKEHSWRMNLINWMSVKLFQTLGRE